MDKDAEKSGYACLKQVVVCTNHRANSTQPSCTGSGGGEALAITLEAEIVT